MHDYGQTSFIAVRVSSSFYVSSICFALVNHISSLNIGSVICFGVFCDDWEIGSAFEPCFAWNISFYIV